MSKNIEREVVMKDDIIHPVQLLKLSRICMEKGFSKQQIVEIMKPISEEKNPEVREEIAKRLIEELKFF